MARSLWKRRADPRLERGDLMRPGGIIVSLNVPGKTVVVHMHIESGKLVGEYNGVTGRLTLSE